MDFQKLVAFHREKNADVTIAMHTCGEADARTKGIAQVHPSSGEPPSVLLARPNASCCCLLVLRAGLARPAALHCLCRSRRCGRRAGKLGWWLAAGVAAACLARVYLHRHGTPLPRPAPNNRSTLPCSRLRSPRPSCAFFLLRFLPPALNRLPPPAAGKVMKFLEKPTADDLGSLRREDAAAAPGAEFLASMGIYVFKREALFRQAGVWGGGDREGSGR